MTRLLLSLPLTLAIAACATTPVPAPVELGTVMAEGSDVALGQAVDVMGGEVVVTPVRVIEDSRCPINARCVRAGELVVETQLHGSGWHETVSLTMGVPHPVNDGYVLLVRSEPQVLAGQPLFPEEYRFGFSSVRQRLAAPAIAE